LLFSDALSHWERGPLLKNEDKVLSIVPIYANAKRTRFSPRLHFEGAGRKLQVKKQHRESTILFRCTRWEVPRRVCYRGKVGIEVDERRVRRCQQEFRARLVA
jgi:hypothetical protein